jgi:hypothetical protein
MMTFFIGTLLILCFKCLTLNPCLHKRKIQHFSRPKRHLEH